MRSEPAFVEKTHLILSISYVVTESIVSDQTAETTESTGKVSASDPRARCTPVYSSSSSTVEFAPVSEYLIAGPQRQSIV